MTPERWRQITDTFHAALARPAAARPPFLQEACAGDEMLRAEVDAMLAAHDQGGAAADVPAVAVPGPSLELEPGCRIGPYSIAGLIGAGGMGRVYRARDARLDRDVAIKILPAQFAADADRLRRFEQEARAPGALTHPNLLTVYDVGTADGRPYLVAELVDGETLRDRISRGAMSPARACDVAAAIARGLAAAHAKGVVHRDLKPENVMITRDGRVKILDFGVAKLTTPDSAGRPGPTHVEDLHTDPGVIVGTAGYMAPEQIRGLDTDGRADVFALGAILFELLTGRRAFDGETRAETLEATLHDDPLLPEPGAGSWPALVRIVQRSLEKDREARFQSAADLAFALETATGSAPAPKDLDRATARPSARTSAAVAVLVAAVAGGLSFLPRERRAPPADEALARFTLPMAPQIRFATSPAISRDGTTIVYAAYDGPVDTRRLYVRRIDQTTPLALPGTEGGTAPFFSPDDESIAFWADNKLKRTRLDATSSPVVVCAVESFLGGAWTADGTIVFGSAGQGLQQVAAEGGPPRLLAATDPAGSELDHHAPEALPGGRTLLVTVHIGERRFRIDALTLATGARRTIIDNGFDARYVPTGHLVYGSGASLFAAPFDPERLETSGPSVQLLDGVSMDPREGDGHYALSETGTLVFLPETPAARRTIAWVDRSGNATPLPIEPRTFWTPRLSPDGGQFAVVVQEDDSRHIWIHRLDNGAFNRLTDEGSNWSPVWSRDGTALFYTSVRNGAWQIMRQTVDRSAAPEMLLSSEHDELTPGDVSLDGRSLIFTSRSPTGTGVLRILDLEGRGTTAIRTAPPRVGMPILSPNGRWLGFTGWSPVRPSIYVRPSGEGPARLLMEAAGYTVWSRSGDRVFYRSRRGVADGSSDGIFELPFDPVRGIATGPEKQLFRKSFSDWLGVPGFDVSSDGRFLLALSDEHESAPRTLNVLLHVDAELRRRKAPGASRPD
jgi:serine/threonine protein kinase